MLDLEPERRIGGIVASAARVHGALRTPTYTASPVARGIREEIEAFCQVPGCSAARVMTVSPASGGDRQGVYPVSVDGPRVRLRDFQESDLGGCMTIVGDPQVTWYLSFDSRSHEQQAALLAADIARAQTSPRPDYYFAAIEKATDTMIGFARLGLDRPRTAELGYAIRRDRWGAGYATEVAMVMLRYGYSTLGLHRVQAACGPDNTASQRVLVKLGFTYEGRMREHVFTNGAWRDSLLYSLLEQEWVALERNATLPIRATGEQPTR